MAPRKAAKKAAKKANPIGDNPQPVAIGRNTQPIIRTVPWQGAPTLPPEPAFDGPEVRQNRDEESGNYGSVAVERDDGRWGIMHPVHGGHLGEYDEVEDWDIL